MASEKTPNRDEWALPGMGAEVVVPHDSTELGNNSRGLWVGGAGNVAVLMYDGTGVTFSSVPAGTLLPIRVRRVNSTNTTAALMVSIY